MSDTVISPAAVQEAADRLIAAAESGRPCAPVRDLIGASDIATAYAVQERVNAAKVAAGATVVGRKIGLTSPAVQQQIGVDQPDLGVLFDDMAHVGGDTVPFGRFLQPKAEAEIGFVLGDDLVEGELDLAQVRASIDYAVAAIEICDSRIADWDIRFGDTVADNASSGAYVVGPTRVPLTDLEPVGVAMRMQVSGQEDSTGTGAACLGDPLLAVQWLARQARDLGEPLRAGQLILSGALGPMRPIAPGATVTVTISGLGAVTCSFSKEDA
jgi:2-keto-4-pentenoate hydratase